MTEPVEAPNCVHIIITAPGTKFYHTVACYTIVIARPLLLSTDSIFYDSIDGDQNF